MIHKGLRVNIIILYHFTIPYFYLPVTEYSKYRAVQIISTNSQLHNLSPPGISMIRTPVAPANGEGPLKWGTVGEVNGNTGSTTLTGHSLSELQFSTVILS